MALALTILAWIGVVCGVIFMFGLGFGLIAFIYWLIEEFG